MFQHKWLPACRHHVAFLCAASDRKGPPPCRLTQLYHGVVRAGKHVHLTLCTGINEQRGQNAAGASVLHVTGYPGTHQSSQVPNLVPPMTGERWCRVVVPRTVPHFAPPSCASYGRRCAQEDTDQTVLEEEKKQVLRSGLGGGRVRGQDLQGSVAQAPGAPGATTCRGAGNRAC